MSIYTGGMNFQIKNILISSANQPVKFLFSILQALGSSTMFCFKHLHSDHIHSTSSNLQG